MKLKKTFAVLLALMLTLSTAAFAAEPFRDVPEDAYYAAAVDWALEQGVTDGMAPGEFRPDYTVNRAQAVTFLWRMAGEPEPTQTQTFPDVEADARNAWYKTAVQWAVEQGITNGTGEGFSPYLTCSRGMILTMLYRMEGKPWDAPAAAELPADEADWTLEDIGNAMVQFFIDTFRSEDGFTDIQAGAWYELPVYWAVVNGILDENHYSSEELAIHPKNDCPRGEMVYFLYLASGDAPIPAAQPKVETGVLPETVLFDDGEAKITLNAVEYDEFGDPRLSMTLVNGTDQTLRAEVGEAFINSYAIFLQAYFPRMDEDGYTFYDDVVAEPGETKDFYVSLSDCEEYGIEAIRELELQMVLNEVEWDEEGEYYSFADSYARGDLILLRTSLYDASVSYDYEGGTLLLDEDGLQVYLLEAEADDFWGVKMKLYIYNGGSAKAALDVKEIRMNGESYDCLSYVELPAGKRTVESITPFSVDDFAPANEVEITFQLEDPETLEVIRTFDPLTIAVGE